MILFLILLACDFNKVNKNDANKKEGNSKKHEYEEAVSKEVKNRIDLFEAVIKDQVEKVKELLNINFQGKDINSIEHNGELLLTIACHNGAKKCSRVFNYSKS